MLRDPLGVMTTGTTTNSSPHELRSSRVMTTGDHPIPPPPRCDPSGDDDWCCVHRARRLARVAKGIPLVVTTLGVMRRGGTEVLGVAIPLGWCRPPLPAPARACGGWCCDPSRGMTTVIPLGRGQKHVAIL